MSVGDVCKNPNLCFAAWKYVSAKSRLASDMGGAWSPSRFAGMSSASGTNFDDVHEAKAHASNYNRHDLVPSGTSQKGADIPLDTRAHPIQDPGR